ncbi:arginase [Geodermatophilus bullaregiensis]|uniref:arginase family protein n=1 Tax=Geodermatophilus bullaregiensis TaxID=1564160 RepID=UPI00195B62ED|nr:arginase family protein [Geodermatophilus bullaregiensis]MBM7807793.1 arginase [Geodermatophilus bullaregiensis]
MGSADAGRPVDLLAAPSSAAAHWPGQERAWAALEAAGLPQAIARSRVVATRVLFEPARWTAGAAPAGRVRDAARVAAGLGVLRDAVSGSLRSGRLPVVVGGECTTTIGLVAGARAAGLRPGLVYVDGGVDLRTPADNPTGVADSMALAHLLALPGCDEDLLAVGPVRPLLGVGEVHALGVRPTEPDAATAGRLGLPRTPAAQVAADPAGSAAAAAAAVSGPDGFLVHLDVDVVEFLDLPLADVPDHGQGLPLDVVAAVLQRLCAHPGFRGLCTTEVNPDHAAGPDDVGRLVGVLVTALADVADVSFPPGSAG